MPCKPRISRMGIAIVWVCSRNRTVPSYDISITTDSPGLGVKLSIGDLGTVGAGRYNLHFSPAFIGFLTVVLSSNLGQVWESGNGLNSLVGSHFKRHQSGSILNWNNNFGEGSHFQISDGTSESPPNLELLQIWNASPGFTSFSLGMGRHVHHWQSWPPLR